MTRRDSSYARATANPVLVGAATVLVSVVAVCLSYNANYGVAFVRTYDVRAHVPAAAGLVGGNDVRVGGKRAGLVTTIKGVEGEDGRPIAELELKLDLRAGPIRDDSRITVRPRSPLGMKYVELQPGKKGKEIPDGGELSLLSSKIFATDAVTRSRPDMYISSTSFQSVAVVDRLSCTVLRRP